MTSELATEHQLDRFTRGTLEYEAYMGVAPEIGLELIHMAMPDMYDSIVNAFAGTLSRPELSRAERELATVAILAAVGDAPRQLATHVKAAVRAGYGPAELRAVCEHVSLYAGIPRALNAVEIVTQVLMEFGLGLPPKQHRVQLGDHATVMAHVGESGPPVVLLHGLGADWHMWEPVMAQLAVGRRVFAYDLRWHGAASGAPEASMAQLAADLLAVLDSMGLDSAHLIGVSLGGAVLQTVALSHPDRVASLTLIATVAEPSTTFEDRASSAESEGMHAQVAPAMERWFTTAELAENNWAVRYAREHILRFQPQDWANAWRAYATLDVRGRLADLRIPTLVLAGELDRAATPPNMAALAQRIPKAIYDELPGASHQLVLTAPEKVISALQRFIPFRKGDDGTT